MQVIVGLILTWIYIFFVFQIGSIQEGKIKNIIYIILVTMSMILSSVLSKEYIGILVISVITILFDLFYDEEKFNCQVKRILIFSCIVEVLFIFNYVSNKLSKITILIFIILIMNMLINYYRNILKLKTNLMIVVMYLIYMFFSYVEVESINNYIILILSIITLLAFEDILKRYNTTFKLKTNEFQEKILTNQYEEIKTVYLNMRGFRHDYHNHIQVIKTYLSMNKIEEVNKYLAEIEGELERIDSKIRSGNLMIDAIVNSKISVAEKYGIKVICKASVEKKINVTDIDLCVILGNLLDNAIESCEKLDKDTFIRIYIAIIKGQLYISIQNSAKEELDFNEKNYISTKRGNHGLGMKRVKILVDKYDGYLNLQNEPGIFASEVTLPL